MSASAAATHTTGPNAAPTPRPVPSRSSSRAPFTNPDLSSSVGSNASHRGSIKSTRSSKSLAQTPPYWSRHQRTVSNVSYVSINTPTRRPPILLEDHTEEPHESSAALWAHGVTIDDYHVVSAGTIGAGSYVVWHCKVKARVADTQLVRVSLSSFIGDVCLRYLYGTCDCELHCPI